MLAVLLALTAAVCFSGSDYAAGLASRGSSVVRVTVIAEMTAAVIASLYPAGTIVLARVLLGERLTTVRMGGLCLAAASVALIAVAGTG
jgi:drug/metabolite transporter (DMT)-like permease